MNVFRERDDIRARFAVDLIRGDGLEIGAGAFPQALPRGAKARYYDVRSQSDAEALFGTSVVSSKPLSLIASDFPEGADFLIAHNVLEHCANPIAQLLLWNNFLRVGGVVLISLPHYRYCHDSERVVPPLSHLIDDYVQGTNGADFASREHILSFGLGWHDDFAASHGVKDVKHFSRLLLHQLRHELQDLHWHALDEALSIRTVIAAATFGGTEIEILKQWSPETGETIGDILVAYKVVSRKLVSQEVALLLEQDKQRRRSLEQVSERIESLVPRWGSSKRRQWFLERPYNSDGGFCFTARLPLELPVGAEYSVTENTKLLGPGGQLHEDIRKRGRGRTSIWNGYAYFSSSDGSNCNENGKVYAIIAVRLSEQPSEN